MLTIFPHDQFASQGGWLLEDPIHEQEINNYYLFDDHKNKENSDSINDLPSPNSSSIQPKNGEFSSFHHDQDGIFHDNKTVKKINHNASERDRRKKINTLYSTLRSLLPLDDQSRKLSIPDTVSRVLKYIPELQKEVERLTQKKETLIISNNNISIQEQDSSPLCNFNNNHRTKPIQSCSSSAAVSSTRISDREIVVQISMPKVEKGSFCEAIMNLEEAFLVLNASCFESFEGRAFYNLHLLQAQGSQVMDAEMLKEKIWSFYDQKGEKLCQF
ncbi:hypothetical protein BUALT_Bualt12G0030400 [Buddleja alternifolia]|uniref:BHLH domain-containing protein n=1 Tax=Buddleja alternifolia TaxID=168488 RepID=A0AAV6WVH1_9LAMI|nr:hypothetical protein BUALT_Bualt12G0030400 [Buddleja alternifolia]